MIWWSKCYVKYLNWSRHIPCVDSIHQLFARISANVNIYKRILRINFLTCSILEGVINGSLATMSSSKISTSVLETNVHYEYGCHGMSCHYIILSSASTKPGSDRAGSQTESQITSQIVSRIGSRVNCL